MARPRKHNPGPGQPRSSATSVSPRGSRPTRGSGSPPSRPPSRPSVRRGWHARRHRSRRGQERQEREEPPRPGHGPAPGSRAARPARWSPPSSTASAAASSTSPSSSSAPTAAGWCLRVLDVDVDTSTANGQLVATVLAAVAQWERQLIAARTSDALAVLHAQGRELGRPSPVTPDITARDRPAPGRGRTRGPPSPSTMTAERLADRDRRPLAPHHRAPHRARRHADRRPPPAPTTGRRRRHPTPANRGHRLSGGDPHPPTGGHPSHH